MKLIESIAASTWMTGFKHVTCARPECSRWLTQRHLERRKVGVSLDDSWYCSYRCLATAVERRLRKLIGPAGPQAKHTFRMPLGLTLVSRGQITSEQLRIANERQKEVGGDLGDVLLSLEYASEKQLTAVRAAQWGCPVFDVSEYFVPPSLTVPRALLERYFMVPLQYSEKQKKISVGFVDRVEYGALYALEQITGCKAQPYLITAGEYMRCVAALPQRASMDEQVFELRHTPSEMRHTLCTFGAEMDAEEITVARCGELLWARLLRGTDCADLLFRVA